MNTLDKAIRICDSNINSSNIKKLKSYINGLSNDMTNKDEYNARKTISNDLERIKADLIKEFDNINSRVDKETFQGSMRAIEGYLSELRSAMKEKSKQTNNVSLSTYLEQAEKNLSNWANSNFRI